MSLLINEILLNIRKSHKLSRKGLENLSGFKERTIISYERGERQPSESYITFMGLYFDTDLDYIKGLSANNKKMTDIKKTLLMYKDIYSYDDNKMIELMEVSQEEYTHLMSDFNEYYTPKQREVEHKILLLSISEKLNIRPSCLGLSGYIIKEKNLEETINHLKTIKKMQNKTLDENEIERIKEENEKHINFAKPLNERLKAIEKKGINLDKKYYANAVKNRNLAKENYTPITEIQNIDKKYKKILDLLPYASDSFLEDITSKLQAIKDIQKL